MGIEYDFYMDDTLGGLTIGEMSNRLEFLYAHPKDFDLGTIYASNEMSPEEMAKIFLKGLTICSYWMDTDKLKALIQKHIDKEIY